MEARLAFWGRAVCAMVASVVLVSFASADVFNMGGTRNPDGTWTGLASLETVPVGNPGNVGELSGEGVGGFGADRICGAVAYEYRIGKYEVTTAQYCEFLNAVAATDTYGLYNTGMFASEFGCKIQRSGSSGNYSYSAAPDWANRPVSFISWANAVRFANWLHNGQPVGPQDAGTTEDGAYTLHGAMTNLELQAVTRNPGWRWAIPTEDEWYKAAYHKNDGVTGNYWSYPTGSDSPPSNVLTTPDPGNNANYYDHFGTGNGTWCIDLPYYRTEVGAFVNSAGPYGTFDQGGNVWELNEAIIGNVYRGMRGGTFGAADTIMHASFRGDCAPEYWGYNIGFRVSAVTDPACPSADLTGDCFVDIADFAVLASEWLTGWR